VVSTDDNGQPVLEQFNTVFIRGTSDGDSGGPDKPDHAFDESLRDKKVGEFTVHVDDDQTYRYRDASGDQMPIHVDDAFAKSVGLPGIIVHGLCTMAMTSQAVIKSVAGGDPARLKRLAVRFSKPVFPGNDVVTTIYDAGVRDGRHVYAFEATSNGDTVIKDGIAEVAEGS
jgi:acyl dehydratase